MQKSLVLVVIVPYFLLLSGCSKDHEPMPVPPVKTPQAVGSLLDSMVWNQLGTTTYFAYRADSLQDSITTVSIGVSDTIRFSYNGRRISHITNNRLRRSSNYFYNAAGQITLVTMDNYSSNGLFRFAYGYDGTGKVNSFVYSLEENNVIEQIYTSTYEYDANGLLSKVNSLSPTGQKITLTIDAYTEECNFNPWILGEPVDPSEIPEIDNLPFLQTVKRLPTKVTKTSGNGSFTRKLTTTINDHNLAKVVIGREFSATPINNFQTDINFFYRH